MNQKFRGLIIVMAFLLTLSIAGCAGNELPKLPAPTTFEEQHEAGSTHIAVLSVAPWEEYVEKLQPTFTLSETKALEAVNQSSRASDETFIDALSFGLRLQPPVSSRTVETETVTEDGEETVSSTRTDREGPGDVSAFEPPSSLATQATSPTPTTTQAQLSGGLDPMLQHLTATALYQEVQLLNGYIRDAVQRTGFKPYVVRSQISVLPSARLEPYDAYTTFSFLARPFGTNHVPLAAHETDAEAAKIVEELRVNDPSVTKGANVAEYVEDCEDLRELLYDAFKRDPKGHSHYAPFSHLFISAANKKKTGDQNEGGDEKEQERPGTEMIEECHQLAAAFPLEAEFRNPVVVPLLVTDSLESTIHSRTTDSVRQFAFALAFLLQGTAGQAEFERYNRNLQSLFGRDLNSLLTVARVSDNVYRVRLGAMQQVGTNFATIPRTHNVTFLLLAPCELVSSSEPLIKIVSNTTWVDHRTGVALHERSDASLDEEFMNIVERYQRYGLVKERCGDHKPFEVLWNLVGFVQENDGTSFRKKLKQSCPSLDFVDFPSGSLWTDLAMLIIGSRYASTAVELPGWRDPTLPDLEGVRLTAFDDAKTQTVVQLSGGRHLKPSSLTGSLLVYDKEITSLPLLDAVVNNDGRVVQLKFPSLKAWGIASVPALDLELYCHDCSFDTDCVKCRERSGNGTGSASTLVLVPVEPIATSIGGGEPTVMAVARSKSVLPEVGEPGSPRQQAFDACKRLDEETTTCGSPEAVCAQLTYVIRPSAASKEEAPKPGFSIKVSSPGIVSGGTGTGHLDLEFTFDKEKDHSGKESQLCEQARFDVGGADVANVESVTEPSILDDVAKRLVKASGKIRLGLRNLMATPATPVKLNAECVKGKNKKGKITEITLPVSLNPIPVPGS